MKNKILFILSIVCGVIAIGCGIYAKSSIDVVLQGFQVENPRILFMVVCYIIVVLLLLFFILVTKDKMVQILSCCFFLLLSGVSIYLCNAAEDVNVILKEKEEKYEEVTIKFLEYDEYQQNYFSIDDLKNKMLRVGFVKEEYEGITSSALNKLEELNVDYGTIYFDSLEECISGLYHNDCDIIAISGDYKNQISEKSAYYKMGQDVYDIGEFANTVNIKKIVEEKDISKEPFNVLLMGYSRTELGSSIGLTDAIVVATVNPQTYTISLISIPRDTYIEVPCYNNQKMKINSGRAESIECFKETVEALLDMKIDYYIESDYEGIVNIVDTIGGVEINNPVEFELDGFVLPKGTYKTSGWYVLEFCRERHHMPNGDFDRQKHQREVTYQICKELVKADNVSLTLKCLDAGSKYINTNLTYKQITELYNLVKNTKNYTGLSRFKMVDFHDLRMTGYASWYSSDKYKKNLWIYRLYKGSVEECVEHIYEVLGKIDDTSDQAYSFTMNPHKPYERALFYHTKFNEKQVHEPLRY